MTIRMVQLDLQHPVGSEEEHDVLEILRSGQFIGGTWVQRAEKHAARLFGTASAVGVSNGTDALMLALQASGVGPGDVVIAPALSFAATAGAIAAIGAEPRLVDVGDHALLDSAAVMAAIDERVRAIVPVHLFGNPCDLGRMPVPLVADAAQAAGSPLPSSIPISAVSTYPTKVWGGAGEGGFVVGTEALVDRASRLSNHGFDADGVAHSVAGHTGRNARMGALTAATLCHTGRTVESRIKRRQRLAAVYDEELPTDIRPIPRHPEANVAVYAVRAPHRDRVRATLAQRDIQTAVYYPRTLPAHPAYAHCAPQPIPMAQRLCEELLALPIHAGLDEEHVLQVCQALRETL